MDLPDEPATRREADRHPYVVAAVEPLDVDGIRTLEIGTIAWLVGFVALLPFYGRLEDADRTWWLWACLAGFGLGLLGLEFCRRKRRLSLEDPPH